MQRAQTKSPTCQKICKLPTGWCRPHGRSALTILAVRQLADVPPALTWFANIDNPQTRRVYQNNVEKFMRYAGITDPLAFRDVAHALAWRRDLELRALGGATIRRKLAALLPLFESLCEANAQGNPVGRCRRHGRRPR